MEPMGSPGFSCAESYDAATSHHICLFSTKVPRQTLTCHCSHCLVHIHVSRLGRNSSHDHHSKGHLRKGKYRCRALDTILWHLGSPANITAYSSEDNELWLRHLLGLLSNAAEAVYIYLRFRIPGASAKTLVGIANNIYYFDFIVIPLLIGGILKYAERIKALRCASDEQLKSALYSEAEKMHLSPERRRMIRTGLYETVEMGKDFVEASRAPEVKFLREAYVSFEIFRPLFLGLPFEISKPYYDDLVFMVSKSAEDAFKLVEIELQFLYDLFFTKNPIQQHYHKLYVVFRGFYFLSALSALVVFFLTMNNIGKRDHIHSHIEKVDIIITYLLLAGAISLDVYGSALHLYSNWRMIYGFGTPGSKLHKLYYWLVASTLRSVKSKSRRAKIAQYDMLKDFCSKSRGSIITPIISLIDPIDLCHKYDLITWLEVGVDLKRFIFNSLREERRIFKETTGAKSRFLSDGTSINDMLACYLGPDSAGTFSLDFELNRQSDDFTRAVFIWHIATKLIYYDRRPYSLDLSPRISIALSGYLLYLVLVHPSMTPREFGEVTKESFLPAKKRSDQIKKESNELASSLYSHQQKVEDPSRRSELFATAILAVQQPEIFFKFKFNSEGSLIEDYMMKMTPALVKGHRFAHILRSSYLDKDEMWEMVCKVWMKLLIYAAYHCSWKEHVQQLRHGGELLTYVSLLMAHLGLSKHIQIETEDAVDDSV